MSDAKSLQRLQIHEAWGTHAHAPGLLRAVRNQVTTNFALRAFNRMVIVTDGRLDQLRHFRVYRSVRHFLDGLLNDAARLAHLFHAHEVAIVRVTVLAERHFEIRVRISGIRSRLANIPSDA